MNIAIDGPAGAGKSTIAKLAAKKLQYIYIDTGAMYRTMALYFIENGIDLEDESMISSKCDDIEISIGYEDGEQHIFLGKRDVSGDIRKENVSSGASKVAIYGAVREKLVALQREMAAKNNVIMDGRDIGSVVLPNAEVKIYLTASVDERAERRYKELKEKGVDCDLQTIKDDIEKRDYQDMHREISPLVKAEGAIEIDSSNMTIDEVVQRIMDEV